MASGKIKGITIEIGGDTTKLGAALKSTESNIRGLQSELNTVNRLLKLDPSNTVLLANKQQILADKINATKEKLQTLKDAQQQAQQQFESGQISTDQYRELTTEVERTQLELNQLEDEASQTASALEAAGNASENAADDVHDLSEATDDADAHQNKFSANAATAWASIATAVTAVIDKVTEVVAKLKDAALSSAAWADTFNTYAAQFHVSTESLQKFAYAADIVDVSVETFGSSLGKLTKNMNAAATGSKTQADAFAKLGVSVTDSNGNLRDAEDVFYDVIDALGQMKNETEADATANAIFGRSFQELNPLVAAGSDTLRELGDEAVKVGAVMSQDALDGANELQDSLDRLKNMVGVVQRAFSSGMAPALNRVVQAINKSLANPQVQKKIENFGRTIGKIVEGFAKFASAVMENAQIIIPIVEGIGAAFLSWKITQFITSSIIPVIQNMAAAMATAGGGIIATFQAMDAAAKATIIGAIIGIGVAIASLCAQFSSASEDVKAFKDESEGLRDTAQGLATEYAKTTETLAINGDKARKLAAEIQTLNDKINSNTLSASELATAQAQLKTKTVEYNTAVGKEVLVIDEATGAIKGGTDALIANTEAVIENAKAAAQIDVLKKAYETQAEAQADFAVGMEMLRSQYDDMNLTQRNIIDTMEQEGWTFEHLSELWNNSPSFLNPFNANIQEIAASMRANIETEEAAGSQIEILSGQMEENAIAAATQTEATEGQTQAIQELTDAEAMRLIRARENGEELSTIEQQQLESFASANEERYSQLEEINQKEQEYLAKRLEIIQNGNEQIQLSYDVSLEQRTANMQHNAELVQNYESNITKLKQDAAKNNNSVEAAAMNAYLSTLMDGSVESMSIVQQMVDGLEDTASAGGRDTVYGLAKQFYSTLDQEQKTMYAEVYETGVGISEQGGEGVASNDALQDEAVTQMHKTAGAVNDTLNQDRSFFFSGQGVIRKIANGMETMAPMLYSTANNIVNALKTRFTFGVSVSQTGSGAQVRAFAKGGVVYGREIVQVAENEPEAIIPLSRMGDIVEGILRHKGGSDASTARTTYLQPQITINAQKLTDNELNRAVRFVSREFAKATGGQM